MDVFYFLKEDFGIYPPCIAQVHLLREAGARVVVICGACPPGIARDFEEAGVEIRIVGNSRLTAGVLGKFVSYASYRSRAIKAASDISSESVLWFGTADTAMALGRAFRRGLEVATVLELYDTYPVYRKALTYILPRCALVVACDPTRAEIMQSWYKLPTRPIVMPNKTYAHPRMRDIDATSTVRAEAIGRMVAGHAIVYQGLITEDRTLKPLATALRAMNDDRWWLYLLGPVRGQAIEDIQVIYPNTAYLGTHVPPTHLELTSHATIGVAYYDRSSLNNVFCAPNKIYEYTGFGIPVLANDVSGLRSTIGANRAGICVDFNDAQAIAAAIADIDADYEGFSARARAFFEQVDNLAMTREVLRRLAGMGGLKT